MLDWNAADPRVIRRYLHDFIIPGAWAVFVLRTWRLPWIADETQAMNTRLKRFAYQNEGRIKSSNGSPADSCSKRKKSPPRTIIKILQRKKAFDIPSRKGADSLHPWRAYL